MLYAYVTTMNLPPPPLVCISQPAGQVYWKISLAQFITNQPFSSSERAVPHFGWLGSSAMDYFGVHALEGGSLMEPT
jgi:hypothetical protein